MSSHSRPAERQPGHRPPPRPRKHLMTPGQPARSAPPRGAMSIGTVQKWILSGLAVTTIMHMSAGLVLAARYVEVRSSSIGLLVISGAFGLMAMAAGLLIHGKSLVNPLMLIGLLPPLLGAWWIFG